MRSNCHYVLCRIQLSFSGFALSQGNLFTWKVKCIAPKAKSAITFYEISILNRGDTYVIGHHAMCPWSRNDPALGEHDCVEEGSGCA